MGGRDRGIGEKTGERDTWDWTRESGWMGGGGCYLGREGNGLGGLMGKEVVGGRVAGGEGEEWCGGRALWTGRVVEGEGKEWRQGKEWWEGEEWGQERDLWEGV